MSLPTPIYNYQYVPQYCKFAPTRALIFLFSCRLFNLQHSIPSNPITLSHHHHHHHHQIAHLVFRPASPKLGGLYFDQNLNSARCNQRATFVSSHTSLLDNVVVGSATTCRHHACPPPKAVSEKLLRHYRQTPCPFPKCGCSPDPRSAFRGPFRSRMGHDCLRRGLVTELEYGNRYSEYPV